MKRRGLAWLLIAVFLSGLLLPVSTAQACSKGYETSLEEDYLIANSIFSGTVEKVEEVYLRGPVKQIKFKIDEVFKGTAETIVLTAIDSDQCGSRAEPGEKYLIYANNYENHFSTNVFNTFNWEDASDRVKWLNKRKVELPIEHVPAHKIILISRQNTIQVMLDGKPIEEGNTALIYNNSTYIPISFFENLGYDVKWKRGNEYQDAVVTNIAANANQISAEFANIRVWIEDKEVTSSPEAFLIGKTVYVPIRSLAESVGLKVTWWNYKSTINLESQPLFKEGDKPKLTMKLSVNFGMEADYLVDKLTGSHITTRYYNYQHKSEPDKESQTAKFDDMIREEDGIPINIIRLFLTTENREVELKISKELIEQIMSKPSTRELLGTRLGKPLSVIPEDLVLTLDGIQ
jgi:Copper amine oxidase N-terminal domain